MADAGKGHGEKNSRKRELFIAALLTEPNIREAAKKAGIGESTGWQWLQDPDFQAEYREARRMAVSQAIAQLQQASSGAVATLCEVMADQEATPASRVTAAKTVLEMAIKGVELEDLAERIEKLEQAVEQNGGRQRAWR